jgi:hypothetical protein
VDYHEKYREQSDINWILEQTVSSQNVVIAEYKAAERARYIFKVPFTDLGLTTEHAQGALVAAVIFLIF